MLRSDLRTRARDELYETTANIWSDDRLNRAFEDELRSLPSKGVYLQETHSYTLTADTLEMTLPTGTDEVEAVERNDGTATVPDWNPIEGWNTFGLVLRFPAMMSSGDIIRVKIRKAFTVVSDDATAIDVPDDESELVVKGMVVRAYKILVGYLRSNMSWDSVTKPGDLSIPVIVAYLREAKQDYNELLKQYAKPRMAKNINLVS